MANEIVKYHNDLNKIDFSGFTEVEMNILFAIISRLKEKGTELILIPFDKLKRMTEESCHYTNAEYSKIIEGVFHKVVHLSYKHTSDNRVAEFLLFQGYDASLEEKSIKVSVSKFGYNLLNDLTSEFTRFELSEFTNLRGTRTKTLYRLLKQFRSTGYFSIDLKVLKEHLEAEEMETKKFTSKLLNPSVNKLRKLYCFRNLTYEYLYKGRKAYKVRFTWDPEKTPSAK